MDGHGTFVPWVARYLTGRYEPPGPGHDAADPPARFGRGDHPGRVVASLTSMPSHIENLRETLDSLVGQTFKLDAIYINVPEKNRRTGAPYPPPPDWLKEYYEGKETAIVWNTALKEDLGSLTKLAGGLVVEKDPDTIVITFDDDKAYPPGLVRRLVWALLRDPSSSFGSCGWSFLLYPGKRGVVPVYVPWMHRGFGRVQKVLQACCGNAYYVGQFRNERDPHLETLFNPPQECFTTDDLWIAGVQEMVHKVPRIVLGIPTNISWGSWLRLILRFASPPWEGGSHDPVKIPLDPADAKWSQAPREWRLGSLNSKPGVDYGCIRAVERTFGGSWLKEVPASNAADASVHLTGWSTHMTLIFVAVVSCVVLGTASLLVLAGGVGVAGLAVVNAAKRLLRRID